MRPSPPPPARLLLLAGVCAAAGALPARAVQYECRWGGFGEWSGACTVGTAAGRHASASGTYIESPLRRWRHRPALTCSQVGAGGGTEIDPGRTRRRLSRCVRARPKSAGVEGRRRQGLCGI